MRTLSAAVRAAAVLAAVAALRVPDPWLAEAARCAGLALAAWAVVGGAGPAPGGGEPGPGPEPGPEPEPEWA